MNKQPNITISVTKPTAFFSKLAMATDYVETIAEERNDETLRGLGLVLAELLAEAGNLYCSAPLSFAVQEVPREQQ